MKQPRGTQASVGIAALYCADNKSYQAEVTVQQTRDSTIFLKGHNILEHKQAQ
jgi:hypothetical protein